MQGVYLMTLSYYYEPLSGVSNGLFTAPSPNLGTRQELNKQLSDRAREEQGQNSSPGLSDVDQLLSLCDEPPSKCSDPTDVQIQTICQIPKPL